MQYKTDAINDMHQELAAAHQTVRIEKDGDMNDRSRSNSLLFHGMNYNAQETWSKSEIMVISLLSNILNMQASHEQIACTHRLGYFFAEKCHPVIVQVEAFKTKNETLMSHTKLKDNPTSIAEDFSPDTRLARKRLLEYVKRGGSAFKPRYNKLSQNGKYYMYSLDNSGVYQLPSAASQRNHDWAPLANDAIATRSSDS